MNKEEQRKRFYEERGEVNEKEERRGKEGEEGERE